MLTTKMLGLTMLSKFGKLLTGKMSKSVSLMQLLKSKKNQKVNDLSVPSY